MGWELLATHPRGKLGKVDELFSNKAIYLNSTILNSLKMTSSVPPQEILYDRGNIRITSTLLRYQVTSYRIRDIHSFTRGQQRAVINQARTETVMFGALLLLFGTILVQPLAMIIGLIILMSGLNSTVERLTYTLTVNTNAGEVIVIPNPNREEMDRIQQALERAIYYSSPGRQGAN